MPNISIDEFVKQQSAGTAKPATSMNAPKKMTIDEFIAATKTQPTTTAPEASAPKKSFLDSILGGAEKVSDFFGGKGIADLAGTTIARATVPKEQRQYVSEGPTDKEVLGSVLQVGSLLAPVGRVATGVSSLIKGAKIAPKVTKAGVKLAPLGKKAADLGGKVVAGGATGAAFDVGAGLQGEDTGGAGTIIGAGLPLVPPALKGISKAFPGSTPQTASDIAGRIIQSKGNVRAEKIASEALPLVDTKGVKTYEDLFKRITDTVDTKIAGVDKEFAKNATPMKLKNLTQTLESESGKATAKVNYVRDALSQLNTLYKRTKDLPNQLKIQDLLKKARSVGLTPSEINQLARDYGTEFKAKGFSKVGQALTNISDQAYENTRKGLKEVARSFLTSEKARKLDKEASQLLTTQKLVKTMKERVAALEDRIKKRGILESAGRLIGEGVDLATGGLVKGFLTKFFPSNVGIKTMNSLDLERELTKNLNLLNRLNKSPDSELAKFIKMLYDPKNSAFPGDVLLRKFFDSK